LLTLRFCPNALCWWTIVLLKTHKREKSTLIF
jgi:hypothetical protein